MGYKRLFIWVEGLDDERLLNRIKKPIFAERYDLTEVRKYARIKNEKVSNFLKSIKAMNADCIFLTDINLAPCVTAKKQQIQKQYKNIDKDRIVVVIKEIESWYLAGLPKASSKKLGISGYFATTDNIAKEQFDKLIPKKFDSRIDFMLEILKCFSIRTAKQKNKSFNYFVQKHLSL